MKEEIKTTVELWVNSLSNPGQDMGDGMGNMLASIVKLTAPQPTEAQIDIFRQTLTEELTIKFSESWDVENPKWNSYGRGLHVDYDPCRELVEACEHAGISPHLLPIKSSTWTSPGKVSHRFGYSAQITDIDITTP